MSAVVPLSPLAPSWPWRRAGIALFGIGLSFFAYLLQRELSGGSATSLLTLLPVAPLIASLGLAASLREREAATPLTVLIVAALGLGLIEHFVRDAQTLELLFGFAALGGAGLVARDLAKAKANARRLPLRTTLTLLAILSVVAAIYNAVYVLLSRDLMIADFMRNRLVSVAVAERAGHLEIGKLVALLAGSLKEDYSWFPALPTGVVLALTSPLSRAAYQGAVDVFYVAPGLLALALLARDLASRTMRARAALFSGPALAFAALTAFAVYPTGVAVAARGMPDIGGLIFYVLALRHADKLGRILAAPVRHAAKLDAFARSTTLALAIDLFAMFVFRRWYLFAGLGVVFILTGDVTLAAWRAKGDFAWRRAAQCASLGALTLIGFASPIIADWLPHLGAHDYGSIYAAYRKPPALDVVRAADWIGLAPLGLALAGALALWRRSRDTRLLSLTVGAGAIGLALFFRIQSPAAHHYYLIAPALAACVGAPLMTAFVRFPAIALANLLLVGALTLTPAGALAPFGFAPRGGLPHEPRPDLDELQRLRDFFDANNRPDHLVCGLGSSYTFSGQLIGELWQLPPAKSPLPGPNSHRIGVEMSDVDTVEGPPNPALKDCALTIVGDPVQTHLVPEYQLTVILPSREILSGTGIGTHYQRTGEVFRLQNGVKAVVFERTTPLGDADVAALAERWRQAREGAGATLRGGD